jgi:enoyl reductase
VSAAVTFSSYGDPDVLLVVDVDAPDPGPDQTRVRVKAAGVQPFDCLFRSGKAHQWMPASFPQRLGNEFAGVIDATGEGVTDYAVGDEVLGWAVLSSHAEHVVTGTDQIVAKPPNMPWTEAGALSASGQTAATALAQLAVGQNDTVLIHAAAGGVGSFAVQIAKARGATVIGTASERNHDYLRSLGAIAVSYGDGLTQRVHAVAPDGVDAAIDAAGTAEALHVSLELVADKNRVGAVAFNPNAAELDVRRLSTERSAAQLAELTELYTQRKLQIHIHKTFPLTQAAGAHREVETGHARGKVVLTVT